MDPASVAFQSRDDFWRFQSEMLRVQQGQADLSDRVSQLERKQEEDSRLKNVWGTSSPFPSVLGGTPQQVPLQQPITEHFSDFEDPSNTLIGNLQLDTDEEPRRIGATSRANSVRFDETANHGHWAHASRSSLDLIPRTGSSMGGHLMSERSYSHKSDGRQSSAGLSIHSATSGRANSLTSLGASIERPSVAPGLLLLGPVPAIVRCWLNTNFTHDALLYAAVCSGSYASYLDLNLVKQLGMLDQMLIDEDGNRKIKLPVFLPEASPVSASPQPNSPAPQLPSIEAGFTIFEDEGIVAGSRAIQVFLGGDTLRRHHADILFSSNTLTLYDDDQNKVRIPLVRPEDDRMFCSIYVATGSRSCTRTQNKRCGLAASSQLKASGKVLVSSQCEEAASLHALGHNGHHTISNPGATEAMHATDAKSAVEKTQSSMPTVLRRSWRKASSDNSNAGKGAETEASYQRRETGMKVLKPSKSARRISATASSPDGTQSRFFDDGRQRPSSGSNAVPAVAMSDRNSWTDKAKDKESGLTATKPRASNPVGGASAFAWLNDGGLK